MKKHCNTLFVATQRNEMQAAPSPGPPPLGRTVYAEKATVEQELGPARVAYTSSQLLMNEALSAVRIGRTLDAGRVRAAISSLTESVLRNPDAMLLFSQLREKGEYAVSHSLHLSISMTAFGRFLQLEQGQIEFLGYVGLLQDIGKVRLPKSLLEKRGRLNVEEFEQAKLHASDPVGILRPTPGLPRDLPRVAVLHHERPDGSGDPNRLRH